MLCAVLDAPVPASSPAPGSGSDDGLSLWSGVTASGYRVRQDAAPFLDVLIRDGVDAAVTFAGRTSQWSSLADRIARYRFEHECRGGTEDQDPRLYAFSDVASDDALPDQNDLSSTRCGSSSEEMKLMPDLVSEDSLCAYGSLNADRGRAAMFPPPQPPRMRHAPADVFRAGELRQLCVVQVSPGPQQQAPARPLMATTDHAGPLLPAWVRAALTQSPHCIHR